MRVGVEVLLIARSFALEVEVAEVTEGAYWVPFHAEFSYEELVAFRDELYWPLFCVLR